METGIPKEIKEFLTNNIDTVSQLELLFKIYQNKNVLWSAASISKELRTHPAMALRQMEKLFACGILKKENDLFSYSSSNETLHSQVEQLFNLYHERPVAIVTFILTKPEDKLKGFADAFKIKKD